MKKTMCLVLSTIIIAMSSISIYADSFVKKDVLSNGECEFKRKFNVKKGEYVRLEVSNRAKGGVTFIIEDLEGNIVVKNALTIESGIDETQKKEVEVDLPKGQYIIKAQGKTVRINNAFVNRDEIEPSNGYFKLRLRTLRYKS